VPEEGCVRFVVGLSPFASPTLLRVDPKKDFAFEMLITACAKYDVLEERVSLCFGIRESAIGEIAPFETLMTSFWRLCRTAEGIPAKTIPGLIPWWRGGYRSAFDPIFRKMD
jgi:hypothetical protein